MHLDMLTMSAVNITVTAILGAVLVFTWARERESPFVGWWGLAQLVLAAGVLIATVASLMNDANLVTLGTASMIFSAALKWKAARQFEYRHVPTPMLLAAPVAFLLAVHSGFLPTFDDRLILVCTFLAAFDLAAAVELARGHQERLKSRWPAVILLVTTAVSYFSWLPLILSTPIREAVLVFASSWFPGVILLTVLLRVALSFLVLAMAKERQELKQRVGALTDPLTGLPNRRALFEAADLLSHNRGLVKGQPVSVLIFDLDRFKETNDCFGHAVGDRVLKIFAATLTQQLAQGLHRRPRRRRGIRRHSAPCRSGHGDPCRRGGPRRLRQLGRDGRWPGGGGHGQRRRRLQCGRRLRSELAVPPGRRRALCGEECRPQSGRAHRPGGHGRARDGARLDAVRPGPTASRPAGRRNPTRPEPREGAPRPGRRPFALS